MRETYSARVIVYTFLSSTYGDSKQSVKLRIAVQRDRGNIPVHAARSVLRIGLVFKAIKTIRAFFTFAQLAAQCVVIAGLHRNCCCVVNAQKNRRDAWTSNQVKNVLSRSDRVENLTAARFGETIFKIHDLSSSFVVVGGRMLFCSFALASYLG